MERQDPLASDRRDVYCASPKAIKAAALAYGPESNAFLLADALIAAHHEKLGEERSVCLRDILEALDAAYHPQNPVPHHPGDFIRGKFGAG